MEKIKNFILNVFNKILQIRLQQPKVYMLVGFTAVLLIIYVAYLIEIHLIDKL